MYIVVFRNKLDKNFQKKFLKIDNFNGKTFYKIDKKTNKKTESITYI